MAPRSSIPQMMPYLDHGVIKYASVPTGGFTMHSNSSDLVGLLHDPSSISTYPTGEKDDALERFTATGRPMPAYKPSGLAHLGLWSAPLHLPQKYTDDSIIPVVVRVRVRADPLSSKAPSRRKSIISRLKTGSSSKVDDRITKVIFMPRGDYLKYFAKDNFGNYIGTEPEREWTEEEVEEGFRQYKKLL